VGAGVDDFDLAVRLEIYRHFASTGGRPTVEQMAAKVAADPRAVRESYARLYGRRMLVLEPDGASIRMAPPFSGVPTMHRVESAGVSYFANCAWDALGVPAALHRPATVHSRCAQSSQPFVLEVGLSGPPASAQGPAPASEWLFHCLVPAAHWWDDIVFT
jgi:Alkylmercury lyase